MAQAWVLKHAPRRGRGRPPRSAYIQTTHIREELPYTDFHPDLDVGTPLAVYPADQISVNVPETALQPHQPSVLSKPSYRKRLQEPWEPDEQSSSRAASASTNTYQREVLTPNSTNKFSDEDCCAEYDMDEQDDILLRELNSRRVTEVDDHITRQVFETTMTKIEQEWNALERRIPKQKPEANGSEDSLCSICDDGECENSNAIVFCDGCNLAVHQDCYGVPYIPEGQWLCRKCLVAPRTSVTCVFCPNEGGAFKQTSTNRWAHLLCAIWIPETSVANTVYMEPIDGADKVPKSRWKLVCYICKQRMGACIQCSNKNCFVAFHVTCARRAKLYVKTKGSILDGIIRRSYCDRHVSNDWRIDHDTDNAFIEAQKYYTSLFGSRAWPDSQELATTFCSDTPERTIPKLTLTLKRKSNMATKLPSGAPIIPHLLLSNTVKMLSKYRVQKSKEFVEILCKWWTLKRDSMRGGTLLKINTKDLIGIGHKITKRQGEKRLELAKCLRKDLESLRSIMALICKREKELLRISYLQRQLIDCLYFPFNALLQQLLNNAEALDQDRVFEDVAGDSEMNNLINIPMSWSILRKNIEERYYDTVLSFKKDFDILINNAAMLMEHNKLALSIQRQMQTEFKIAKDQEKATMLEEGILDVPEFNPVGLSIVHEGDEISMSPLSEVEELEMKSYKRKRSATTMAFSPISSRTKAKEKDTEKYSNKRRKK